MDVLGNSEISGKLHRKSLLPHRAIMASTHDEQDTADSAGHVDAPVDKSADGQADDQAVDELDSAAIAAAMGFSSFGMQSHPNKKRRFNPRADAVVAAASSSRGNDRNASAGPALQHPLPQRPPPRANADEIDLEDDDDVNPESAVPDSQLDGSVVSKARHGQATVAAAADNLIRSADRHGFRSDLTASPQLPPPPGPAAYDASDYGHDRNRYHGSHSQTGSEGYGAHRGGGHGGHGGHGNPGGPGGRERRIWWTDYYDPTSNQNPWAQLEAGLGLPACGTWLERNGPPTTTAEPVPSSG